MEVKKKEFQAERLYKRLINGPIDPITAWKELGIYRLAARINELKNRGYSIESKRKKVKNNFGETFSVAEYRLSVKYV